MIECPYCISEVDAAAVACKSCGRDLAGHLYVLRKLSALEQVVQRLEAQGSPPAPDPAVRAADLSPAQPSAEPSSGLPVVAGDLLKFVLLQDVLLVAAHHLLVFTWDRGPLWLLGITLVVPLLFGVATMLAGARGVTFWGLAFLLNAVAVVLMMSLDTTLSAGSPTFSKSFLPANPAEWVQDGQFSLSLWLSAVAGCLATLLYLQTRHPGHRQLTTSALGVQVLARRFRIALAPDSVDRAGKYVTSFGALASAIGALYLGVQRL